jgi:hypothetical protein
MDTKKIGQRLENIVVEYLKEIYPKTRLTKASGACGEAGDVLCSEGRLKIECKVRDTDNCIIERKWWLKLNKELNLYNMDTPVLVLQNKHKETFVCMDIKDWIRLLKERK